MHIEKSTVKVAVLQCEAHASLIAEPCAYFDRANYGQRSGKMLKFLDVTSRKYWLALAL